MSVHPIHLPTSAGKITIRPLATQDIAFLISYMHESPPEFLEKIGFDLSKRLDREAHRTKLFENVKADHKQGTYHSVAAQLEDKTIAAVFLPLRELPDTPRAHFHIFDLNCRAKGLGLPILKAGLQMLLTHHKLSKVYIEPKFDNKPMNRLLQKAGFHFLGETIFSGPTTIVFKASRYEVLSEMVSNGLV